MQSYTDFMNAKDQILEHDFLDDQISVRITKDLQERLKQSARKLEIKRSKLIKTAIQSFLDYLDQTVTKDIQNQF